MSKSNKDCNQDSSANSIIDLNEKGEKESPETNSLSEAEIDALL
jgi:hypothetical protein